MDNEQNTPQENPSTAPIVEATPAPQPKKARGKLGENKLETISLTQENLQKLNTVLGMIPEGKEVNNATRMFVYLMDVFFEAHTMNVVNDKLQEQVELLKKSLEEKPPTPIAPVVPAPTKVSVQPTLPKESKAKNLLFPHL